MYLTGPITLAVISVLAQPQNPAPASPAQGDTVELHYTIARAPGDARGVRLTLELTAGPGGRTELLLPDEWAGRDHLYAGILDLEAETPGASLEPDSAPSMRWLAAPADARVTLAWRLHGDSSAGGPESHNFSDVGDAWAQLIGYDALILPALPLDTPVHATLRFDGLPTGTPIATSFGAGAAPGGATVEMRGRLRDLQAAVYTFGYRPEGVRHYPVPVPAGTLNVAVRGGLQIPDSVLVSTLRRVVSAERAFWGNHGSKRYLVSIGPEARGGMGGVRLTNAFVADVDSTAGMSPAVAELFAHELMHEWIGGLIYPAKSVPDRELKWFTEGFTEYLSHRVLWQTGVLSDSEYVAVINGAIREQALSPASGRPWSEVVAGYWTDGATRRQAYLRGWILGLRLEAIGRAAPAGHVGLVAALRQMLPPEGELALTRERLDSVFARVVGPERARAEVDSALAGGPLQVPVQLFGECVDVTMETGHPWEPGFDVQGSMRARVVQGVKPGTAAAQAGLRDGMKIRGASIWNGDPTKPIRLRVEADSVERTISYLPVSARSVPVQQFRLRANCRLPGRGGSGRSPRS